MKRYEFILGHISAACISIQEDLDRQLLWIACRHHVGEIILTWVWNGLKIEISKSPEITLFQRFRDQYDSLSHGDLTNLNFLHVEDELQDDKTKCIQLIKKVLSDKTFAYRGDYTVFLKVTLVLLTGDLTNFKIPRPGAVHKARWMMKGIISQVMYLMMPKIQSELPKNSILTAKQADDLKRFVKFICLVYVPWWVTCPLPADSPINDLTLLKTIRKYPDTVISTEAEKAMLNHCWYLTEELVPLALFSP